MGFARNGVRPNRGSESDTVSGVAVEVGGSDAAETGRVLASWLSAAWSIPDARGLGQEVELRGVPL